MIVRSVTAHAFGPLHGETLRFADGMTVVHGANESAKSSWHAAIYAALCGRRRGRVPSAVERRFAELHRPWDRDEWVVSAAVLLDDGRRLEIRQDLAGRVDCDVRDLDLGRDCSDEFISDGTPDLARWLGLDRHSFLATACVAQAQVLAIHDRAGGLREQLQRAAATAGADQTAAAALAGLEAFRREQVGGDRAPRRPLRMAGAAVARAEAALADARTARDTYERSLVESDQLRAAATVADRALRGREAALAAATAAERARALRGRLDQAEPLAEAVRAVEPAPTAEEADTARQVVAALSTWDSRPAALPDAPPDGPGAWDDDPDRVASAADDPAVLDGDAGDRLAFDGGGGDRLAPDGDAGGMNDNAGMDDIAGIDDAIGLTDQELWDLARDMESVPPPADPATNERVAAARAVVAGVTRSRQLGRSLLVGASVIATVAVVALAAGLALPATRMPAVAAAGVLAAVAVVGAALSLRRFRAGDVVTARQELDAALFDAAAALRAEQLAVAHREGALSRASRLGLPPHADGVREVARRRAGSTMVADRDRQWRHEVLQERERAERRVSEAKRQAERDLASKRVAERRLAEARLEAERQLVRTRRELAHARHLERRAQIDELRQRAADQVVAAARRCGMAGTDPDGAAAELEKWQRRYADRVAEHQAVLGRWDGLRLLLGVGRDADEAEVWRALDELRESVARAEQRAEVAAAHEFLAGEPFLVGQSDQPPGEEDLEQLRERVQAATARADLAEGARLAQARGLPSVGEAEEELARTRAELHRVTDLDETLELTREFLVAAQERAHRTIAPVLVEAVAAWLPTVTEGRYTGVIVDPEKLRVQVRGPASRWRDADALSHGTAEQIYLLLRIALARHLARPGTVCPLLLDDVTVHADVARTGQILELLLAAAEERQIILFTQQDEVRDWARARLTGARHATHSLAEPIPA